MHWRQCALPGAQQLTGGAVPPFPCRARSRCVRLAPRAAPVPRASHPTSNPLFTDGRPVSGAFVLPAPLHDDRSNLMPFLCPASNAIRLRSSSFGTRCTNPDHRQVVSTLRGKASSAHRRRAKSQMQLQDLNQQSMPKNDAIP